jgi:hypothetical protein
LWRHTISPGPRALATGGTYIYVLGQNGLVKFNRAGALIWTRTFGAEWGDEYPTDIAANATNIYVSGVDYTTFYWDDPAPPGFRPQSVRRYNSSGNLLWTSRFGTLTCRRADYVTGTGGVIAIDTTGIYVVGGRQCVVEDGGGFQYFEYKNYVANLSLETGQVLWFRSATLPEAEWVMGGLEETDIAVNANGVYISGSDIPYASSEEADVLLLKFGKDGSRAWGLSFGIDDPPDFDRWDLATSVAASSSKIWIAGYYQAESGHWPGFIAQVTE